MGTSVLRAPSRAIAVLAALAMVASMLVFAAPAQADGHEPEVQRFAGSDRFDTAAQVATDTYPDGADDVIVAAGFNFPDALAASGVGGAVDAPILLVNDINHEATDFTLDALEELDPDTVHIAGGVAAVSVTIESELEDAGDWDINRFAGADRFETAALMADVIGDDVADDTAIVATGRVAADSLAAGPLANQGPHPILLADATGELSEYTAGALEDLSIENVLALGGTAALSDDVVDQIEDITGEDSVERLAGDNRFETAIEIAGALDSQSSEVLLATGFGPNNVPADALAGGPYGGVNDAPLLPINDVNDELPDAIGDYLEGRAGDIDLITILGGTAAVSADVANAAQAAATPGVEPTNQAFTVTSHGTQIIDTEGDASQVNYAVSGLEADEEYVISLFSCGDRGQDASVKRDGERYPDRMGGSQGSETGTFTFRDQDLDDLADGNEDTYEGDAYLVVEQAFPISDIGGVGEQQIKAEADDDGEIDFIVRVEDDDFDCAVPVVWHDSIDDGASEDNLDLDSDSTDSWNQPAENFGVGGTAVFHLGEEPAGWNSDYRIVFLDVENQWFQLDDNGTIFFYGLEGDTYRYTEHTEGGISEAIFEDFISIGDRIDLDDPYSQTGNNPWELDRDSFAGTPVNVSVSETAEDDELLVGWDYPDPVEGNITRFGVRAYDVDDLSGGYVDQWWTDEVFNRSRTGPASELEVDISGLDAGDYVFRVTSNVDGDWMDSSLISDVIEVEGPEGPVITDIDLTDTVTEGLADEGDIWELTFDQEMDTTDVDGIELRVEDEDGDATIVVCRDDDTTPPDPDSAGGATAADCQWDTTGDDDVLVVTLLEEADDRTVAGDGDVEYSLEITQTWEIESDAGVALDLENSVTTIE